LALEAARHRTVLAERPVGSILGHLGIPVNLLRRAEELRRKIAARAIQRAIRPMLQKKKRQRELQKLRHNSAVRIQSSYRGYITRQQTTSKRARYPIISMITYFS